MLEWFTTIPGILIICGVILLVIAIILFVVGAKKSQKEVASNTNVNTNNDMATIPNVTMPAESVTVSPVTPVESTNTVINDMSANMEPSTNIVEEPIHVSEPEIVSNQTEEVSNVEPVINMPTMEIPTEVSEVSNKEEVSSTIYGGEIPTAQFSINEEKPVTIYGGNDPLEATQALPKVEEHHEPYGGNYPEARIVESVQPVEAPTPVEEVVSAMPTVEPTEEVSIPEPSVITIPDVESVEETTPAVVSEPTPITISTEEVVKPTVEEL